MSLYHAPLGLKEPLLRAEYGSMRIVFAAIAAAFLLAPGASAHETVGAHRQSALETQLVQQINTVRRAHGLKPLKVSSKLASAAAEHTREMGTHGYFEHESLDSTPFWK